MKNSAVPALTRAMRIFELLAEEGQPGLGVTEIAARTGIAKSTTALICSVLEEENLVRRHDNRYLLGRRLLTLAGDYLATVDQLSDFYDEVRAQPVMSRHSARLAMLDGTDVIYLARYEVGRVRRVSGSIGDRFPASITATGKAILMTMSPAVVADRFRSVDFPRFTEKSIQSLPEFLQDLDRCRERGYAMDDEETNLGQVCFAVPVRNEETDEAHLAVSTTLSKEAAARDVDLVLEELRAVADIFTNPLAGKSF
ncbi:IclR family transcriptional regulator [Actinomyces culturomici]|uniref:IclR family transcriptional regulator n=1 Tax=Actinomyces culturomici TaxID=1926276 RepID=UPI000E20A7AC|nr:IclR family transcriptional regulator [Actinomyces culturomici]